MDYQPPTNRFNFAEWFPPNQPTDEQTEQRKRLLRFNVEHLEHYYRMGATENPDEPYGVVLIDCCDPLGGQIAAYVAPERYAQACQSRPDVIPTLHIALRVTDISGFLRASEHHRMADCLLDPPLKHFPVVVIAGGGKSLAYLPVPQL